VIADRVWKIKLEPILFMPANGPYTTGLDRSALTGPDTDRVDNDRPRLAYSRQGHRHAART
jgi:hypothetical protein